MLCVTLVNALMKLTAKDLRAIELVKKYDKRDLIENLKEYYLLADTLIYVHEAISEERIRIKYWQKYSETLLYKFIFHGLTLHNILSGLKLHSDYYKEEMSGKTIIDIASAKSILRSQFEAFLMYHYIYVNPKNNDLKELRYNAWIYSSLLQRQEFPAETEYGKKQKAKDIIQLDKLKSIITNLGSFKSLSPKQQQSLLNSGSGKLFSHWATILKETGFTEKNPFYMIYTILSIYSHSEGLSVIQLEYQPDLAKNSLSQANLDLHHSKLLICLMINSVIGLFKSAKERYETLPANTKYDVEIYCTMAIRKKT
jgi:hypothetical protein